MSVKNKPFKFFLNFLISIVPLFFIVTTLISKVLNIDSLRLVNDDGLLFMIIIFTYQMVSFEMGVDWERGWKDTLYNEKNKYFYSEFSKTLFLILFSIFLCMFAYGYFGQYWINDIIDEIALPWTIIIILSMIVGMAESLEIEWLSRLDKWLSELEENEEE